MPRRPRMNRIDRNQHANLPRPPEKTTAAFRRQKNIDRTAENRGPGPHKCEGGYAVSEIAWMTNLIKSNVS